MWQGTNQDGKNWEAKIDEERFTFSLIIGDTDFYMWTLDEFINEKHKSFLKAEIREEMLLAAIKVKEKEKKVHTGLSQNWVCLSECTICSSWPEQLHEDLSTNSSNTSSRFPPEVEQLKYVCGQRRYDSPEIKICPQCGTYYKIVNEYEWTTIGDYDDDYLTRLTPKEALDLIPETGKEALKARWNSVMDSMKKCLYSNKPHIVDYAKRSLL